MSSRRDKILKEGDEPDDVVYEVEFYYENDDGIELYEKLSTNHPPCLPDRGEKVSFDFVTDSDGEEVFRTDSEKPRRDEISSDGSYDRMFSYDFTVKRIKTTYKKHVCEEMEGTTTVEKVVLLSSEIDPFAE